MGYITNDLCAWVRVSKLGNLDRVKSVCKSDYYAVTNFFTVMYAHCNAEGGLLHTTSMLMATTADA